MSGLNPGAGSGSAGSSGSGSCDAVVDGPVIPELDIAEEYGSSGDEAARADIKIPLPSSAFTQHGKSESRSPSPRARASDDNDTASTLKYMKSTRRIIAEGMKSRRDYYGSCTAEDTN